MQANTAMKDKLIHLTPAQIASLQYDNYRAINELTVEELVQSIKEVGVKEPITVTCSADSMKIVTGHHRVEAVRRIMRDYPHVSLSVKAVVSSDAEVGSNVHKVVSNLSRRENLIDRASGYATLARSGKTTKQIADIAGRDKTSIEAHLKFHAMYLRHKNVIEANVETLKESFLYKLAAKFSRDDKMDIKGAIEKELAPKSAKKVELKVDAEGALAEAGFGKTDVKKILTALRNAGIKL